MSPEPISVRLEGSASAVDAAYAALSGALVSVVAGARKNRGGGLVHLYVNGVVDVEGTTGTNMVIDVEVVDDVPSPKRRVGGQGRRALEGGGRR